MDKRVRRPQTFDIDSDNDNNWTEYAEIRIVGVGSGCPLVQALLPQTLESATSADNRWLGAIAYSAQ